MTVTLVGVAYVLGLWGGWVLCVNYRTRLFKWIHERRSR